MREKGRIKKDFKRNVKGEFGYNGKRLLLEVMLDIRELLKKKKIKRKPSEWNRFFAKRMKQGMAPKQIGKLWQKRKQRKRMERET